MKTKAEVVETYLEVGKAKTEAGFGKTFALAVMAGVFIAFGGIASTVAGVAVPSASKLVGAMIFPGGLAMVILAGSELFTGNCLLAIPLLANKITMKAMFRNWGIVYAGNFVGSLLVAGLVVCGHSLGVLDGVAAAAIKTAASKCSLSFGDAFARGILCNVLVCTAVWISFFADTVQGKVLGIFFPITMFVLCGFEHSVANMYFIGTGLFASSEYVVPDVLSWSSFLFSNLLPVTLGNIVGGVSVGMIYKS